MERISNIELPKINKITDLIETETLDLILKGLSQEKRALVVEEMDGNEIKRVPGQETILTSYWSPLCNYLHKFKLKFHEGKHSCRNSTEDLAREIIEGKKETGRHQCFFGLEVFSIPFLFQGRIIGVLLGGKYRIEKSNIEERLEKFYNEHSKELQKENFNLEEAKKSISGIKKVSEEDINNEIERLKDAAKKIMRIGKSNYTLRRTSVYHQFRLEMLRYFIEKIQAGLSFESIIQKILEEIKYLFKVNEIIFILRHRGEEIIIPQLSVEQGIVVSVIDNIKKDFKKKDDIYWWKKEEGTKPLASMKDKLKIGSIPNSAYATFLSLGDGDMLSFLFIEPGVDEDDFSEFIRVIQEIITIQFNLWVGEQDKADFIAAMVHRLKAPMQLLMTKCSTLENSLIENQEMQKTVQGVKNAVSLLDHQTKSYSFITAKGERDINIKRYSVYSLLKKCIQKFEPIAKTRNIRFQTDDIRGRIEDIEIDKEMMDVALSNLFDNAIKYSSAGSFIQVRISFDRWEKKCYLSITNKGIYRIQGEEREKIFDRYYRTEQAKKEDFVPGTGIGLAVVKEVIEKVHKGKVEVESELIDSECYHNRFSISLPYHQEVKIL